MDFKIYQGECAQVMREKIADESVNFVLTSPPYDDLRDYNGYVFDCRAIGKEIFRVLKEGGVLVWVVADRTRRGSETGTSFRQALFFKDECGFRLHDTMIYAKNSYMPLTHNRYEQAFEYMFAFSKGRPAVFNPIMIPCVTAGTKRARSGSKQRESTYAERKRKERTVVNPEKQHPNIFFYNVGKNDKTNHNAPFPEELARDQIITWSNPGDVVLDPMCGSGTTGKMAVLEGRNFIGIDISEKYVELSRNRINNAIQK